MTTKSSTKPAKPKASSKPAKPKSAPKASAKPKSAAKPKGAAAGTPKASAKQSAAAPTPKASAKQSAAATPKTAAKSAAPKPKAAPKKPAASAAPKKPAAKAAPRKAGKTAGPDVLQAVKPLIRVRQARAFTAKKVTRAELDAITEVARWSGTSRNEQPLRFVAIRDQARIREIADFGLPQTRGLPTATAAVAIVEPDEPERAPSRAFDDGRAAERMLIAAHLLGLGGGISQVRPDVRDRINKALNLPGNRSVRTIVAFGHPTEDALAPKSRPGKARLPREELIYEEQWPDPPAKD